MTASWPANGFAARHVWSGMARVDLKSAASAAETADYVCGIARELRTLSARADLGFLAYLLAMVADEAEATHRRLTEDTRGRDGVNQ